MQEPDMNIEKTGEQRESLPKQESNGTSTRLVATALALMLAGAAFFAGHYLGSTSTIATADNMQAGLFSWFKSKTAPDGEADLEEFWRVWNLMEEKFAFSSSTEQRTPEERIEGAISGLVKSYDDPYTVYLPPQEADDFAEEISGNFGGVGMEVGIRDNIITVIAPLPDTPAERAGIMAGDAIVAINEESTEGMSTDEAVKRIRGEAGTTVQLRIFREGATEFMEKTVTREQITIPTVKTETKDGVFIIRLYSFNALAETKMQEAMREYIASGSQDLIIDLRGNPGGYLQSAVAIASYFLPSGKVIVRESYGDGREEDVYRSSGRTLRDFAPRKVVILIDKGSASASEIMAGALKEHGVATLVGETTFGKGSVQELVPLPDGSSLKVTIARWLTPNGTSISENGFPPDIEVARTAEQVIAGEDPQEAAALEFIKKE